MNLKSLAITLLFGITVFITGCASLENAIQADTPGSKANAYCGQPSAEFRAQFFRKLDQA